ncbi:hypothetical protein PIB30_093293 [Stylosanthes scabra]|uniref:Ubiquitin-like protease family profile domain-containing protein n=1 Tax=Stylosanthes scabra TaxID=79078 RepID=A0ABU6QUJ5_9FABA|nr:hypothetical protein [Stylosanthes scabra]
MDAGVHVVCITGLPPPNSIAKITPVALPTIFDLENTRSRNWAHHVHNFLLQELEKAKQKKSVAIHGCCYALMIIYFHETQFGERSRDPAAQPPWLAYWTESQSASSTDGEGDSESESQLQERRSTRKEHRRVASPSSSNSEDTVSEEPPQNERRMKQKNDRAVVGSNAPFNPTQQSAAVDGLPQSDNATLANALKTIRNTRKRKKQQTKDISTKKRSVHGVEGGEERQDVGRPTSESDNGSDRTRMFDSFDTVSLGRGDTIEGPSIMPSQPSQPSQTGKRPLQPEQPSTPQYNEVDDPVPINMEIPLETQEQCSLTLHPWLQPEAGTSTAVQSPEAVVTNVLLSMNREESDNLEDQCTSPDIPLQQQYQNAQTKQDLEEWCATWATLENNNKYETIFQLRGPTTIKAMRYNFLTMAPATCIDIQMVSLMCHVLNREKLQRFEWDVYCVPPEILTRMFDTYGINYLDKKTKLPYRVELLKDHAEYMRLLDRDKLKSHSALFAPVVYSNHWWFYVLDVDNKEFYIIDSVHGINPNQQRAKLHRFTGNVLNQLRVWAGAKSILKKGTVSLQLKCVDVPKQPNPTDCGVYFMKWMELLDAAMLSSCYAYKVRYNLEEWGQDKLDGFRREMVAKLILSKENTLRVEAISQANKMGRQTKPFAALQSPYVQVSTAELEKRIV